MTSRCVYRPSVVQLLVWVFIYVYLVAFYLSLHCSRVSLRAHPLPFHTISIIANIIFFILTRIARDLLAISVSGVNIERLFNNSRDIYYYRRDRLRPETIRLLIIKLYITRFKLTKDLKTIKS